MSYQTLNHIHINTACLKHNYKYFQQSNPQAAIAPVLKANAYGHGLTLIGKWIDQNLKAPFICVDSLYEAYELTKSGVKTPLLILGFTDPANFKVWKRLNQYSFPVWDEYTLSMLNQHQPGAKIHLKIDTGMCRLGIKPSRIGEWFNILKRYNKVRLEGIYSHLSQADDPAKKDFTKKQVQLFKDVIKQFESRGVHFKYKHIAATSSASPYLNHCHSACPPIWRGEAPKSTSDRISTNSQFDNSTIINFSTNPSHITDPTFNLIRLGLGFYGYSPFELSHHSGAKQSEAIESNHPKPQNQQPKNYLKPSLTLTSRLAQIKRVEKGSQLSYGGTYTAKKDMTIGILPIGYSDGLPRSLSNHAQFIINLESIDEAFSWYKFYEQRIRSSNIFKIGSGSRERSGTKFNTSQLCIPILGRICMNMTIIDLTNTFSHDSRLMTQDSINIISPNPTCPNSVYNLAKQAKTIPYEILTCLNPTIRRTLL